MNHGSSCHYGLLPVFYKHGGGQVSTCLPDFRLQRYSNPPGRALCAVAENARESPNKHVRAVIVQFYFRKQIPPKNLWTGFNIYNIIISKWHSRCLFHIIFITLVEINKSLIEIFLELFYKQEKPFIVYNKNNVLNVCLWICSSKSKTRNIKYQREYLFFP